MKINSEQLSARTTKTSSHVLKAGRSTSLMLTMEVWGCRHVRVYRVTSFQCNHVKHQAHTAQWRKVVMTCKIAYCQPMMVYLGINAKVIESIWMLLTNAIEMRNVSKVWCCIYTLHTCMFINTIFSTEQFTFDIQSTWRSFSLRIAN